MSDVPVPRSKKNTRVGLGGEMCVFLTPGLREPTVAVGGGSSSEMTGMWVCVTVRQVLGPCCIWPDAQGAQLPPGAEQVDGGRGAERRGPGSAGPWRCSLMGSGSGEWVAEEGRDRALSARRTTVHAYSEQAHAPFIDLYWIKNRTHSHTHSTCTQ